MGLGLASAGIRRLEMGKGRGIGDLRDGRSSPRGSGWAPTGMVTPPPPREHRAAKGHQAHPEEAHTPKLASAKGAL